MPAILDAAEAFAAFQRPAFQNAPVVDDTDDPCPECPHSIGDHEPHPDDDSILVCTICDCAIAETIDDEDDDDDDEDFDDDDDDDEDEDEDDDEDGEEEVEPE